jgi:hypothetical protein
MQGEMMRKGLVSVLPAIGLILLCTGLALGQVDMGEILGTVRDTSGAVVPGAKVTILSQETGLALTTATNSSGIYVFNPIKIGTYKVTASKTGFENVSQSNIVVNIQAQVKVDLTLTPGKVTTTVQVTAASPQLQTQSASTGQVITTLQVGNLPLATRNYTFLAQLSPGVTTINPSSGRGMNQTGSFVANGAGTELNNYILNGIDNNNDSVDFLNGTAYVALPPPDALSEFKVQTSDFSAEFGRAGGAVVNATIKSGTNQLHGDAWEFNQNNAYDAAGFFENASHTRIPKLTYNQFGFTLGGPVVLPHIYNGRNKTFFFVDYQGTRIATQSFQQASVPTEAEIKSGYTDFRDTFAATTQTVTDALGRTFNANTIFDPGTTRPVTAGQVDPGTGLTAVTSGYVRDPFYLGSLVGVTNFTGTAQENLMNQLPGGRIDPNAVKILGLYPAPNTAGSQAGTVNNFAINRAQPESDNHFDVRVDQNFSSKDQMFAAVSYDNESEYLPGSIVGIGSNAGFGTGNITNFDINNELSWTHIFAPTLVNEFRIGFSRLHTVDNPVLTTQSGIPAEFGIQGISQANGNYGLPNINIDGLTSLGAGGWATPNIRFSNTWQVNENLTKVSGKHTFKGGFEAQFLRFPWLNTIASRGQFYFGEYTGIPNVTSETNPLGMADLLLTPIPSNVANGINYVGGPRYVNDSNVAWIDDIRHYYGAYFQDNYKVLPKLTLDLGLRWEFFGQIDEKYGANAIFEPGVYCGLNKACGATYVINSKIKSEALSPSFTSLLTKDGIGLQYSSVPGLINTPLNDFTPRTGLAWQATKNLVVRLGYGIFFGGFQSLGGAPDPGFNYPNVVSLNSPPTDPAHPIVYADGQNATLERGLLDLEPYPNSPSFSAEGLGLTAFQNPGWMTGYTQEWNVTLQYQVTPNQTVSLGYMGNTSSHLMNGDKRNLPNEILPPGTNTTTGCTITASIDSSCLPFPDFSQNSDFITPDGSQFYYGFNAEWQRRFSQGLQTLVDYTYSRCMTDTRNILNSFGDNFFDRAGTIPGFGGIKADYRFCGSDSPNILHADAIWQLPFGRGQHFGRSISKLADLLVGGWQAQGIVTMQNGFPDEVGCNGPSTNGFPSSNNCVADLVPGQNLYQGQTLPGDFLNPKAFATPPVDTTFNQSDFAVFGGRPFQFHGPSYDDLDFSMFKTFKTSERTSLEFRAEFFNFLNTPQFTDNFSNLNYLSTVGFSQITQTAANAVTGTQTGRMIQFALKFYW